MNGMAYGTQGMIAPQPDLRTASQAMPELPPTILTHTLPELDRRVDELSKAICVIEERLAPVLRPLKEEQVKAGEVQEAAVGAAVAAGFGAARPLASPVGERLEQVARALMMRTGHLHEICRRIEV